MYSDGSRSTPYQLIRYRANVQVSLVEVTLNQPVAGSSPGQGADRSTRCGGSVPCGWRKPHPGVCWALGERVRHSFVAAIGQLTTRCCMNLAPFLQSAHTDRADVAS